MSKEEKRYSINDDLVGIAIGVKYRPNYAIEDKLGEIVDELLYSKESIFNYLVFPNTSVDIGQKILANPSTGDTLTINRGNMILELAFSDKTPKSNLDMIVNEFFKIITENIYKKVNIHEVYLIGLVYKYILKNREKTQAIVDIVERSQINDLASLNMSFTKKIPTPDGIVKKDVNDYDNVIHTIIKLPDQNEMLLVIDYQRIFEPKLDSIVDIKYKDFVLKAKEYNTNTINDWISKQNVKK